MINKHQATYKNKCKHEKAYKTTFGALYCPTCDKDVVEEPKHDETRHHHIVAPKQ